MMSMNRWQHGGLRLGFTFLKPELEPKPNGDENTNSNPGPVGLWVFQPKPALVPNPTLKTFFFFQTIVFYLILPYFFRFIKFNNSFIISCVSYKFEFEHGYH